MNGLQVFSVVGLVVGGLLLLIPPPNWYGLAPLGLAVLLFRRFRALRLRPLRESGHT